MANTAYGYHKFSLRQVADNSISFSVPYRTSRASRFKPSSSIIDAVRSNELISDMRSMSRTRALRWPAAFKISNDGIHSQFKARARTFPREHTCDLLVRTRVERIQPLPEAYPRQERVELRREHTYAARSLRAHWRAIQLVCPGVYQPAYTHPRARTGRRLTLQLAQAALHLVPLHLPAVAPAPAPAPPGPEC